MPDPLKTGINNQPFHRHQDHPARMKDYTSPVIRLLAMLVRKPTCTTFDLPQEISERVKSLKAAMIKPDEVPLSMHVLRLLVSLWSHTWISSKSHPFPDPTVVCLALMMLESDGRTMLFEGSRIAFDDIRKVFVNIEEDLIRKWEEDVLSVSYSFISDRRNPFGAVQDSLIVAILSDPTACKRFILWESGDQIVWNKLALRSWLYKYAQFEGLLLVRGQMLGGAPSRGTELTAMTFQNIATSTHRNCVAFGKYLAMLVTYHKGTAMTGSEKLIPHAFDGITIMHQYTESMLGIKLGLQSWRQVSIAFRRKLCSALEDLMDVDDQDTVAAQQAMHSRRTENCIYGLSADALSGVAEDVLPLYLDASMDWQVISHAMPGGLRLSYQECRSVRFASLVESKKIVLRGPTAVSPVTSGPAMTTDAVVKAVSQALQPVLRQSIEQAIGGLGNVSIFLMKNLKSVKHCIEWHVQSLIEAGFKSLQATLVEALTTVSVREPANDGVERSLSPLPPAL
ncbi:hypothetical protein C0993_008246 [Termitomyces sp. T159_Od127]|nr:hypothetical protein C0993_008246 [Termitomyces sp. T159_Od127]